MTYVFIATPINETVDIKLSVSGACLEWPSSGTLKIEKLESQIIWSVWEQSNQRAQTG